MKKHLLLHNFSNISNNTGLPNFYRIVALYSQANLKSKIYTLEDIKVIDLAEILKRLFSKFSNNPFNNFISNFIYVLSNRNKFDSFILLTKSGIYTCLLCRFFFIYPKISVVLYELPIELKYKDFGLFKKPKLKIQYYFLSYALHNDINILFICPKHLNQFKRIFPDVKANYFNYGIDSNFYLSYVKESSNNLKNEINYSSKPYILFVGGAYRDKNLISQTLNFLESCSKDLNVLSTSFNPSFSPETKKQLSSNYYQLINLHYSNYLQLVLRSFLVVISLDRPESMAGLTSFLEISTLSSKLLINETIYSSHYFKLLDENIKKNIYITSKKKMLNKLKNIQMVKRLRILKICFLSFLELQRK